MANNSDKLYFYRIKCCLFSDAVLIGYFVWILAKFSDILILLPFSINSSDSFVESTKLIYLRVIIFRLYVITRHVIMPLRLSGTKLQVYSGLY